MTKFEKFDSRPSITTKVTDVDRGVVIGIVQFYLEEVRYLEFPTTSSSNKCFVVKLKNGETYALKYDEQFWKIIRDHMMGGYDDDSDSETTGGDGDGEFTCKAP